MSSKQSSIYHDNSLPPLHQAIPEFHSHNPHERRSSSVPRKLVASPSSRHRTSPGSAMATLSDGEIYDAQAYMFPGSANIDVRRTSSIQSASPSYHPETRSSSFLPPVSSMTSSRGSSLDIENENSRNPTAYRPSSGHPGYSHQYEHETRNHHGSSSDYHHRYSTGSVVSPTAYRSASPGTHYSQAQYYSHTHSASYAQSPRNQNFTSRQTMVGGADGRIPFSPPNLPADLSMDQFEANRPGKRRRGNLPKHVTDLLRSWLNDHLHHPYPTEDEKQMLMAQTGLTIHQISNWFINARRRRLPAMADTKPSTNARRSSSGH